MEFNRAICCETACYLFRRPANRDLAAARFDLKAEQHEQML